MTPDETNDTNAAETPVQDAPPEETATWESLELTPASLEAVGRMGFDAPSEVQAKSIPRVHRGIDLVVQAKTGSGKTLAFGLPILERLDPEKKAVQSLVLCPTRELAVQVSEEITRAGALGNRTVVPVFGGASMNAQIERIRNGAQVVVGTPGRILDHLRRGTLTLDRAWMVVLDEADEMLDRGFLPDVMRILEHTPADKQTMFFSATIPAQIQSMAERYMKDPEKVIIGKAGLSINYDIHHSFYKTGRFYKFVTLVNILHALPRTKTLVFCNQKSETESVAESLYNEGFAAGYISGDLSQHVRTRMLDMFKDGSIDILVATDVAARGIDVFGISHVINYDIPENKEMYVHRTGRTGRAGRRGEALSIIGPAELLGIGSIQKSMGFQFEERSVPDEAEVNSALRNTFFDRLKLMEEDGHPDDLSLLADEILERVEPYTAVAGLLTFLRQRGWALMSGYDPESPEHKVDHYSLARLYEERKTVKNAFRRDARPPRGGSRSGGRDDRRRDGKPSERKTGERTKRESEGARKERPRRTWLSLSLGREGGLDGPKALLSLVCRTGDVKKGAIGKVIIEDKASRFLIDEDQAERVIEAFRAGKSDPPAEAAHLEKPASKEKSASKPKAGDPEKTEPAGS